jgi:hypothetical protein
LPSPGAAWRGQELLRRGAHVSFALDVVLPPLRAELMMFPGDHLYLKSHRSVLLEFLTAQLVLLR